MKAVDFYKLQRAIQDRFVGSTMSGFPPAPILVQKGAAPTKGVWLALSGVCLVALVIVARLGYGSLESDLSLHSTKLLPLYFALFFGLAFGLLQAVAHLVRERALPYAAGVYLFPACLIDARSDGFSVFETKELSNVEVQGASVKLSFLGGASYVLPLPNPQAGASIVAEIHAARDRSMHAGATEDPKELVAVDPLHNPRFSSPVGPRDPYSKRLPPWGKLGFVVAAVVGIILGPTLWYVRNSGSDKTMYATATAANDTATYKSYLDHGDKFKGEVAGILLPRSELHDAEKPNTVESLLTYKASHPNSQIEAEVSRSIRAAMLAELEKAKALLTLAALDDFAKKYPEHGVEPELKEAKHAVYMRELDSYKKRYGSNKDKTIVPFVERLFAFAEKNGPKIEVRFKRKKSESLDRADQYVAKTPSFGGMSSYPSRYFDEKHDVKRETAMGKALATKLDAGSSPELFDFQVGAPIGENDPIPTDVKVPTLFIAHGAEWSGHTYMSQKPRGSYVGLLLPFEGQFVIPSDAKPVKLKAEIFKQAALGQLAGEENATLPPGQAEEKVYDAMADDAFDQFATKITNLFLPKEKAPPAP